MFWEQPGVADSDHVVAAQPDADAEGMLRVPKPERERSQWMFGYRVPLVEPKRGARAP